MIYTLTDKTIKVDYLIKNLSSDTMYFNIGSHEGNYTPEGIPDIVDSSYDITEKEGIISLEAKSEYVHTHSITIL